jgi:glycosyltransferase involved in cell wall biosynthesis
MTVAIAPFRRPRVLLLAYACSPVRGSEAGVGWQRALQASAECDTWVVCEEHEFADEIRQHLDAYGPLAGLHFIFVPMPRWQWLLARNNSALWYPVLKQWHRQVYRAARQWHEQVGFDLIHQVTFSGYREPSYLWKLGVPFLWGPIGGVQNYPWRFLPSAGLRGALKEGARNLMNSLQLRFSPRVRAAARRASRVLAATTLTQEGLRRAHGIQPEVLLETGLARVSGRARTSASRGDVLRILWSGMLLPNKALHLLIEALARLPDNVRYELRVLGEGPQRERWQRLATRIGVAQHITWLGRRPHEQALRQYDWSDVFVFSSLRDTSGNVVLEALAAGVPVICLDHQGMRDVVTEKCGIKVPVIAPRSTIEELAHAIGRLARDVDLWERLSVGAIQRGEEFLWSRQGERMMAIYREVLDAGATGSSSGSSCATMVRHAVHRTPSVARSTRDCIDSPLAVGFQR